MRLGRPERVGGATRRVGTARAAAVALVLAAWAAPVLAGPTLEIFFRRLDRTYSSIVDRLAPIEIGPATVALRSPEHSLRILHHLATLEPDPAGGHRVAVEVRFAGEGRVEADVVMGAVASQLADDLVVPEQTLRLEGRAAIARVAEGYKVTALELPESIAVRIQSRLAGRLVGLCRPMALVLVSLDCGALEQALGVLHVPLPGSGAEYLLPAEEVEPDERARLDEYLRLPAPAAPGS
jgi:hypothetical protein